MALSLKKLARCDRRTKSLVNGYIHAIQKLLPWQENSYFIIPESINYICLSFYWIGFAFNTKYMGENLEFPDYKTVTKSKKEGHSLCSIGEAISSDICDIFRIEFKILKADKDGHFCPWIGFLKLKCIDSSSVIDWNESVGYGAKNGKSSVALCIYSSYQTKKINTSNIYFWDKGKSVRWTMKNMTKVGDTYMFEFDFTKSECYVYHNEEKIKEIIKLECTHIIPCLSLYFIEEAIEITKYEFN